MYSNDVKLLGSWVSPFATRAMIAFNVKCVKYEFVAEDLLMPKSDLLLKHNPTYKKVPVLIHGDRSICESQVIVQYIDEVWASGPSILPSDPYDRAIARFWTAYIDDKLAPAIRAIQRAEGDEAVAAAMEEASRILIPLDEAFTKCSKGQKFFGGDRIGFLDISLGCFLSWIWVIEELCRGSLIDESRTPNLFKWAQDFRVDDAVKDALRETDKLLEFAKTFVVILHAANRKQLMDH